MEKRSLTSDTCIYSVSSMISDAFHGTEISKQLLSLEVPV